MHHGKGTPRVRAIVRHREMGVKMGRSLPVVRGAVLVAAVPEDQDSAGQEGLAAAIPECGLVPTGAAVVRVDLVRALAPEVVAFLVAPAAAFLEDRGWRLVDQGSSFRKTPRWSR